MGFGGFVASHVLAPFEALVAGGAKETFTRIPLDGGVFDRNQWGTRIEYWAGAYGGCVHGWPRAERGWSGAYDANLRVLLGAWCRVVYVRPRAKRSLPRAHSGVVCARPGVDFRTADLTFVTVGVSSRAKRSLAVAHVRIVAVWPRAKRKRPRAIGSWPGAHHTVVSARGRAKRSWPGTEGENHSRGGLGAKRARGGSFRSIWRGPRTISISLTAN